MIQTVIFSKNRACQLDLLLRSLQRLRGVVGETHVIYKTTDENHEAGYRQCRYQNPGVKWHREKNFRTQTMGLISSGETSNLMFLCDDDVVTGHWPIAKWTHPDLALHEHKNLLCVSLRLGANTTHCYPLSTKQALPSWYETEGGTKVWCWYGQQGDFGYPGSLDGHVFNRHTLRALLANEDFQGPNQLEDRLQNACLNVHEEYPKMACYEKSIITGVPVNIVNQTHNGNRNGEKHPRTIEELNNKYLQGKRLNLGAIRSKDVTGAHTELNLAFP